MENIKTMTPEEKGFYLKIDEEYNKIYTKFLDDIKQAIGPIPPGLMSAPVCKECEEYTKLIMTQVKTGSFVHALSSALPAYGIPCGIYQYLVKSPSYKENPFAKMFTYQSLGAEMALMAFKSFVDCRESDVSPEVEAELKKIYRDIAEFLYRDMVRMFDGK